MKYNIEYVSYNDNDQELLDYSVQILDNFFSAVEYSISHEEGQVLYIASGGSEQNVVHRTKDYQNIVLLCHRENNSFAAAIEIAAYLRAQNLRVSIIDVFATNALQEFQEIQKVNQAIEILSQQKAALIGHVADWLIISDVESQVVKEKLGIELIRLPWNSLSDYRKEEPSTEFLEYFPDSDLEKLQETAKVYSLLEQVVREKELSAISVECFSLVSRDKVTACLPLAVFNNKNIVAACEGDLCSMIGKMLIRAVTGEVPWQANVAEIKEDTILFAHCTAPLNLLKSFDITTHFETDCGTAIKGKFEKQKAGIFRVNNNLDKYMLIQGDIVDSPDYEFACRTQAEFITSKEQTKLLKEKGLGNHQLVFSARHIPIVIRLMQMLDIYRVI